MVFLIDAPGATATNGFTEGNPFAGLEATIVSSEWLDMVQEELENLIVAVGLTPDKADNTQVVTAFGLGVAGAVVLQVGTEITVLAPSALSAGQAVRDEDVIGIAKTTEGIGDPVAIQIVGTFTFVKKTGVAILPGERIYYDDSDDKVTTAATTGFYELGVAFEQKGSGDTTLKVRIGASNCPTTIVP